MLFACMLCAVVICAIVRTDAQAPAPAVPTFSKDVAPILYKNCTNCHRPGEIAPMSLLTYQDARPWAKSIATRVAAGTMPPWHAEGSRTEFVNDRRLSDADKATLVKWASAGAPEGNSADRPPLPKYAEGWTIGQPDAVLAMQEDYAIPASGTIAYQYFEVPTHFTEDKWVQAFEVRPGNRAVVHHVIVYAVPPARPQPAASQPPRPRPTPVISFAEGMDIPAGQTGGPELPPDQRKPIGPNDRPMPKMLGPSIGGYVPGNGARIYGDGTATKLAAGSTLVFQMHYTTTGRATSDRTRIGFVFAKEPPKTQLLGAALINGALHIPAGAPNHRVDAEMTINQDMTLWSLLPHTHVRGRRWEYQAIYPDGRAETILTVPRYDFEWQTDYIYAEPLKLPKGTKIHATAWYDNSAANKSNPDPTTDVWWGDQTFEEMMFTAFTFSLDTKPATPTAGQP
jgi:hypothetical protein